MPLLQISEPGGVSAESQAQSLHENLAVGIDLGTTHSLVAFVQNGVPEILHNQDGEALVPSIVGYYDDRIQVGNLPHDKHVSVISSVKRALGKSLSEVEGTFGRTHKISLNKGGIPVFETLQGTFSPIEISAHILTELKQIAEMHLQKTVNQAVITVPAYFDDAQRQATKDAAALAGLKVLRLLNEPTAAAVAYGLDQWQEGTFLVYDLGGGTFDVSILKHERGVLKVLATGGNTALGGDDFDQSIVDYLLQKTNHQGDLSKSSYQQLIAAAKKAKEQLSQQQETRIHLDLPDIQCTMELTRAQFESLIADLVKQTLTQVQSTIKDAQLDTTDLIDQTIDRVIDQAIDYGIDTVVLVGGSTRIPLIVKSLTDHFGKAPMVSINPDEVVALGAAKQAHILSGHHADNDLLLLDVIPLSLGLETMGGLVEKIVPRNTTIPVTRKQVFTTYQDGQTGMQLQVVQGERDLVKDNRSLAHFELKGLPPKPAGACQVEVSFQVDADGLLNVTARETHTNIQAHIEVKPSYGLTEDAIATMLKKSTEHAQEDIAQRQFIELKIQAEQLIDILEDMLNKDGKRLLNPEEMLLIHKHISTLKQAIAAESSLSVNTKSTNTPSINTESIKKGMDALNKVSEPFAMKRMDDQIKQALVGSSV